MESSGNVNHLEPHLPGADWSPRISFSHSFACIQRVPSPTKKSPLHDSEFEFSRSITVDLLSADELFCDGKLRLPKLSHESGKGQWEETREEPHNAGGANPPTRAEEHISIHRRAEKVEMGKKAADFRSPTVREEREFLSVCRNAEKLVTDDKERSSPSKEGLTCAFKLEMGGKAGKTGTPTGSKDGISERKLEIGEDASKSRSPTSRKEPIPACKQEISNKEENCGSPTSREDVMSVCKRVKQHEQERKAGKVKVPTSTECSPSLKSERSGTPVRWREELLCSKRHEEKENASLHLRRLSKDPRSASMVIEGSCMLGNRGWVSLDNSRCPSPSRSFSLPATTPASPSASISVSRLSSSSFSSSGRYRSKIKDFFKLKKLVAPKEVSLPPSESSFSTCRLPISPRSLFAFFKSKESTTHAGPEISTSMPEQAHEKQYVCNPTINTQHNISFLTLPHSANKAPPNPLNPSQVPPSSTSASVAMIDKTARHYAECASICPKKKTERSHSFSHGNGDGPVLVIDEGIWAEGNFKRSSSRALDLQAKGPGKQGTQRVKKPEDMGNMVMVGSKGGHGRPKGMERPLPYTSSVRVTPVLNVPSCITPSLRKAKSSTKSKAFSFENIFARRDNKALV